MAKSLQTFTNQQSPLITFISKDTTPKTVKNPSLTLQHVENASYSLIKTSEKLFKKNYTQPPSEGIPDYNNK